MSGTPLLPMRKEERSNLVREGQEYQHGFCAIYEGMVILFGCTSVVTAVMVVAKLVMLVARSSW